MTTQRGTPFTTDEIHRLRQIKKIEGPITEALPGALRGMVLERVIKGMENKGEILEERLRELLNSFASGPLKLAEEHIRISSLPFSREKFLSGGDDVEIGVEKDTIIDSILSEVSDEVPAFEGTFSSFDLVSSMRDAGIREEKGNDALTPDEWLAKTRALILRLDGKEKCHLVVPYKINLDYVVLRNGQVVAACVARPPWCNAYGRWHLAAFGLDNGERGAYSRVFARK